MHGGCWLVPVLQYGGHVNSQCDRLLRYRSFVNQFLAFILLHALVAHIGCLEYPAQVQARNPALLFPFMDFIYELESATQKSERVDALHV